MKRMTIPLLLVVWTLALAVLTGQSLLPTSRAEAQPQKARQKWEYATLVFGETALDLHWQSGKTILETPSNVEKRDPTPSINELYRKLGGNELNPTLGMILNLIGQDSWEMVSFTHPPGVQIWTFKRASQ